MSLGLYKFISKDNLKKPKEDAQKEGYKKEILKNKKGKLKNFLIVIKRAKCLTIGGIIYV